MKKLLSCLLKTWGCSVQMAVGEERTQLRCILEPTTSRSWQNMRRFIMDLGELPQGQFEYVGELDISAADYLLRDGKMYLPRRCEPIYFGDECICYWGLAVPVGEESAWNS